MHPADRFILLGAVEDPAASTALGQLAEERPDWWGLIATAQYNRCLMYLEQQLLEMAVVFRSHDAELGRLGPQHVVVDASTIVLDGDLDRVAA